MTIDRARLRSEHGLLRKGRAKPKAKSSNFLIPVLILLVVVLGGLAALFGLQQLSLMR